MAKGFFASKLTLAIFLAPLFGAGCRSPYYQDQGALLGGVTGAGVGALVGNAVGNTGAGALVGAGVGALSGAAIGSGLDDIEARNRAQIASQMGRQIQAGAVSTNDVVAMSQAGVNEELIVNHIRGNGVARPLQTGDLIALQQQGVTPRVIQAMQEPSYQAGGAAPVLVASPAPVIVEEYHYGAPVYYAPRPSFGFSYHSHGHHHRHR